MLKGNAEFKKILKEAQQDHALISNLDPDELLRELAKDKHNYIENKTNADVLNEIRESIADEYGESMTAKETTTIIKKLVGYRVVDELDAIHIGQYTRWIQKYQDAVKLTNGGILVNTIFTDEGINLVIKLWNNSVIQVRFDDCLVYQKLGFGEQIILMASDYVNS